MVRHRPLRVQVPAESPVRHRRVPGELPALAVDWPAGALSRGRAPSLRTSSPGFLRRDLVVDASGNRGCGYVGTCDRTSGGAGDRVGVVSRPASHCDRRGDRRRCAARCFRPGVPRRFHARKHGHDVAAGLLLGGVSRHGTSEFRITDQSRHHHDDAGVGRGERAATSSCCRARSWCLRLASRCAEPRSSKLGRSRSLNRRRIRPGYGAFPYGDDTREGRLPARRRRVRRLGARSRRGGVAPSRPFSRGVGRPDLGACHIHGWDPCAAFDYRHRG